MTAQDSSVVFWEKRHEKFEPFEVQLDDERCEFLRPMLNENNNVLKGKKVLEVGAGNGIIGIYLAKYGATVTAIDNTQNSVHNILRMADYNGVLINAMLLDAMEIDKLKDKYDYIVGRMVLHHIEPFDQFVPKMHQVLKNGGKGLFCENSSSNKLLMFCRMTIVGRFGIPKFGDDVEVPFQKREIEMIKKEFGSVTITHLEMLFWRMLGKYIFRKNEKMNIFFSRLDDFFYKKLPFFNKFSYVQEIYFVKN
jgi:2-polyprenyl-3-methyl-5-hydroxy-6-metoxy-1,4-benzoquinol methylase